MKRVLPFLLLIAVLLPLGPVQAADISPVAARLSGLRQAVDTFQTYLPIISTPGLVARPASCDLSGGGGDLPPRPEGMAASGTVRMAVIFVDFPDFPANAAPQDVFAMLSPGARDFYAAQSYGRMDFQLEPYFTWLRMSQPSAAYGFSDRSISGEEHFAYIQEAASLADPLVDFAGVDGVTVVANPEASTITYGPAIYWPGGSSILLDGTSLRYGATSGYDLTAFGYKWLNHEIGHAMGLGDLYAYNTPDYNATHRFVGGFSVMGQIVGLAPEMFAYERLVLGWLDEDQVICQQFTRNTTRLSAIETSGGVKAVMLPVSATSAVVVESRRPLGYDSRLPKSGALVTLLDLSIPGGSGTIQIYPTFTGGLERYYAAPLALGESVTVQGVTVTVVASDAAGDTVEVSIAP